MRGLNFEQGAERVVHRRRAFAFAGQAGNQSARDDMTKPGRARLLGKRPEPRKPFHVAFASAPAFIERPGKLGQSSTRGRILGLEPGDRKSTRLNSSH